MSRGAVFVAYLALVPVAMSAPVACQNDRVMIASVRGTGGGTVAAGAGGYDGGDGSVDRYYPQFMSACMVDIDDPQSPCAEFGPLADHGVCEGGWLRYGLYDAPSMKTTACLYGPGGAIVAWERVAPDPEYCGGHAFAIFAATLPKGRFMHCLLVDSSWYGWDTYPDGGQ